MFGGRTYHCWCGEEIPQTLKGRKKRYCSDSHRIKAFRARKHKDLPPEQRPAWANEVLENLKR